jgi:hypothetical protein
VIVFLMVVRTRLPSSSHSSLISNRVLSPFVASCLSHSLAGGAHPRTALGPLLVAVGTGTGAEMSCPAGCAAVCGNPPTGVGASRGVRSGDVIGGGSIVPTGAGENPDVVSGADGVPSVSVAGADDPPSVLPQQL